MPTAKIMARFEKTASPAAAIHRLTAAAAARQQEALANLDPDALPSALREMLVLRLDHPDSSLAELARIGGLTKSAANHRLRRLTDLSCRRAAPGER